MRTIEVLDKNTIDKIAAGEVVERPASVVKELVENAIDADSTAITVEIRDGGCSLIRITDNGCGIPSDQVKRAFLRHATSKIRKVEDLTLIASLGFRGEALSSIAAVAQVELITKTPDALTGTRYCIDGGTEKDFEEVGAPQGSTFLIRNLFFNTPARAKFLKSGMTEGNHVTAVVEQLALSHPDISFKYLINGQNKLYTSGNGNLQEIIYQVYGRDIARELIELSSETDNMKITGFIGKPVIARGNRNFENYFVNGRYVKSKLIAKGIEDGYHGFMMQHHYPFTLLYLTINGEKVDVNVHPSKMELRFSDQEALYHQICLGIQNALMQKERIPEIRLDTAQKRRAETMSDAAGTKNPTVKSNVTGTGNSSLINDAADTRNSIGNINRPVGAGSGSVDMEAVFGQSAALGKSRRERPVQPPEPFETVRRNMTDSASASVVNDMTGSASGSVVNDMSGSASGSVVNDMSGSASAIHDVSGSGLSGYDLSGNLFRKSVSDAYSAVIRESAGPEYSLNDSVDRSDSASFMPDNIPARDEAARISDDQGAVNTDKASASDIQNAPASENTDSELIQGKNEQLELFDDILLSKRSRSRHRIIGQVFDTYWLVEFNDSLYIIDQHAAHEKVLYERLVKQYKQHTISSQMISPPAVISLSSKEASLLEKYKNIFEDYGYEVEFFGGKEYKICAVPSELYRIPADQLFRDIMDQLEEIGRLAPESIQERLASMSCKAAVKGNNRLSYREAEALIDELLTLENPYNCPHGRPTIISMTKYEMEKKFNRIV